MIERIFQVLVGPTVCWYVNEDQLGMMFLDHVSCIEKRGEWDAHVMRELSQATVGQLKVLPDGSLILTSRGPNHFVSRRIGGKAVSGEQRYKEHTIPRSIY